jgi:hypothetical protein
MSLAFFLLISIISSKKIYNFSIKLSTMLILEMENDKTLFEENKNEELFCSLLIVEMPSSCFM